ncbi:hypothetical protein [Lihuaxuella thermophila]|uniref:Uncharacterized protein n=1 Tax=Lihuaxuella thermophila TaxID=1173111 RepID=A0A1H8ASF3_9BACL|nr:hypothetical protein [Lihuaxuella thermophila]SEM73493.1 hypothetical protein SAMN05444955_101320 [Lihuaxuella thermophila]
MEKRKVVLKLDHEAKRIICRLLDHHVNTLRKQAEEQKTFTRLLIEDEIDRTIYMLEQIYAQWKHALPSLPYASSKHRQQVALNNERELY